MGFFALEDIDLTHYAGRSVPMDVVLGRERTRRSQVIKQADVVALLGLLPEEFAGETGAKNFRLLRAALRPRQLAQPRHAWARRGQAGLLRHGAALFPPDRGDRSRDTHVAIDGGVHIAALGGIWLTAVLGFAGLSLRSDGLALDPQLPPDWRSLGFRLSVAGPPPQDQDRSGRTTRRSGAGSRRADEFSS